MTRSSSFGRTRVRSITLSEASSVRVPLTTGREGELHLCMVAQGRLQMLGLPTAGHGLYPGDAFVVLNADTASTRLIPGAPGSAELVRISVPQLALEAPVPIETGTVIRSAKVPMMWPVISFAKSALLIDLDETSSLSVYYLERLIQEMTIGVLVDHARSKVAPRSPTAFTVALSVIVTQCSDSNLTPAIVAGQVGISLRQLQRTFAAHDITIEAAIRQERVEQAIRMLRSPDYTALNVTDVAHYVGFSNGSGLARAMNALGYPSPRRVRDLSALHGDNDSE